MSELVRQVVSLPALHWPTVDPFLFCAHHHDDYPAGNDLMGPAVSLDGRRIGMDFDGKDGWNMYHGDVVPGFPRHPHRGFETVTLARAGFIDHADSLGATARFGHGDVQWMTAGRGIVHAEMFPLVQRDRGNPAELFQIWLNLPRADKLVDPHFTMLWNQRIPRHVVTDDGGRTTTVAVIAGDLEGATALPAPPSSWAARPEAHVAIWTVRMEPGARWTMPPAPAGVSRALYFFRGAAMTVGARALDGRSVALLDPAQPAPLVNGDDEAELLVLQGMPLDEPVVQHGPFVMNTPGEIQQAMADYQRTQFGGWPWDSDSPVHDRDRGRFAVHADGRTEDADV